MILANSNQFRNLLLLWFNPCGSTRSPQKKFCLIWWFKKAIPSSESFCCRKIPLIPKLDQGLTVHQSTENNQKHLENFLNHVMMVKSVQPLSSRLSPKLPRTLWPENCKLAFWGQDKINRFFYIFRENVKRRISFGWPSRKWAFSNCCQILFIFLVQMLKKIETIILQYFWCTAWFF